MSRTMRQVLSSATLESRSTAFDSPAIPGGRITTLHMLDWLGSASHRSVGVSLMSKLTSEATQFGLGGSAAAQGQRAGPIRVEGVVPGLSARAPPRALAASPRPESRPPIRAASHDLVRNVRQGSRTPRTLVECRRVASFDDWRLGEILGKARRHAVLTDRTAARLNHFLRFPRQSMSGWEVLDVGGRTCGFALLNVIPQHQGRIRIGKIVDCLVDSTDVDLWHATLHALTHELARQNADLVQAFASAPWMAEGVRRSGFDFRFELEFHLHNRQDIIPRDIPFHFTPLEADYAYT